MKNVSTVLRANDSSYTGDPINSTYPVHNATLHFNGRPYQGEDKNFTCTIIGVNEEFLRQYPSVSYDNLTHLITVHITSISSSSLKGLGITVQVPF